MRYRLGVDIGGTFTDIALLDEQAGAFWTHKQLTTPDDPARAVLEGVEAILTRVGVPIEQVDWFAHGTTLVTNAVIERRGARTGMLVTAGFRDVLDMGYETRYDLFDLRLKFPTPVVPRALRREIGERLRYDGSEMAPLDEEAVRSAVDDLVSAHGIEALAICFLHSFVNPAHEQRAAALCAEAFPALSVSTSADVVPVIREYERWTTATLNAYTQPLFSRYVTRLEDGLVARGFVGRLVIMASSGGVLVPETARRYPVRALESGPAAGVLMATHQGRTLGLGDLISYDMGGTTAKGALVRDGAPLRTSRMEVARVHEFKRGSGLPVFVPTIDMVEIGAGGGSIAEVDERGLIRVGPRSAGADPGPACYGQGGDRPTLTDANLVLGYLDPAFFLGGSMALDVDAARAAIDRTVAAPLGLTVEEAAWGIHETINEDVARAFRVHAAERGFDYRRCDLVSFGGSGPAHATRVARKLKAPRVAIPIAAGVLSAFGLLVSPLSFERTRSYPVPLADLDCPTFVETLGALAEEARAPFAEAPREIGAVETIHRLDMRYEGQGHEVEVTLPSGVALETAFAQLSDLFGTAYAALYAASDLSQPIEVVAWKAEAIAGTRPAVGALELADLRSDGARAKQKGERRTYFAGRQGFEACPVFDRYALASGDTVAGPALIEERESTCVIDVGCIARVRDDLTLMCDIGDVE